MPCAIARRLLTDGDRAWAVIATDDADAVVGGLLLGECDAVYAGVRLKCAL